MVKLSIEALEFVPNETPKKTLDAKLTLSPLKLNPSPTEAPPELLQPVDEERVFAAFDQLPWTPGNGVITPSPNSGRSAHTFWKEKYGRSGLYCMPPARSYRAGSKSPQHSQRSPLSVMTHASHMGSRSSPGSPASYLYTGSSSSSPASAGRANHQGLISGPFAAPQGCIPMAPHHWPPGCPPPSPHGQWMPRQHFEHTAPFGMPPLSPHAHPQPPSPNNRAPQMATIEWRDSAGQYWRSTAPISPMHCFPPHAPPTPRQRSGKARSGSFVADESQNISPNMDPCTPTRMAAKPRRATPPQDSPTGNVEEPETPCGMRPKAPSSSNASGGALVAVRKPVGATVADLQTVEILLQQAADSCIDSKPVQDLLSLVKPLDASGAEMNARQRRTLRRAIERVEQELRADASTDEEEADPPITTEAATADAATSEVACPLEVAAQ